MYTDLFYLTIIYVRYSIKARGEKMNEEELILRCNKITIDADREVRRLKNDFSIDKCEYGIGDIIEDHYHIIEIEDIRAYTFPNVVYIGTQLTKKLDPTRRQDDTRMYSMNVKRKIK